MSRRRETSVRTRAKIRQRKLQQTLRILLSRHLFPGAYVRGEGTGDILRNKNSWVCDVGEYLSPPLDHGLFQPGRRPTEVVIRLEAWRRFTGLRCGNFLAELSLARAPRRWRMKRERARWANEETKPEGSYLEWPRAFVSTIAKPSSILWVVRRQN